MRIASDYTELFNDDSPNHHQTAEMKPNCPAVIPVLNTAHAPRRSGTGCRQTPEPKTDVDKDISIREMNY